MKTLQIKNPGEIEPRERAQNFLDQAEEDLLFATICIRKKHRSYNPITQINYLLHQSIEKWLKTMLQIGPGKPWGHDVGDLLESCIQKYSELSKVEQVLKMDEEPSKSEYPLLKRDYPSNLRYREGDAYNSYNLEDQFCILLEAAFLTRRLVKRWLINNEEVT